MNNFKRISVALLVAAMTVASASCSDGNDNGSTTSSTTTEITTAATTTAPVVTLAPANSEYTNIFKKYGITETPTVFNGLEYTAYATAWEGYQLVEKREFGHKDGYIYEWVQTNYYIISDDNREEIENDYNALTEQYKDILDIRLEKNEGYYAIVTHVKGLNDPNKVSELAKIGVVSRDLAAENGLISLDLTEQYFNKESSIKR